MAQCGESSHLPAMWPRSSSTGVAATSGYSGFPLSWRTIRTSKLTHGHLDILCFMGEQITIFLTLFKVKRTCLDRFSSSPAPLGVLQYPVTILKVTTSDKCCDNLNQCRYNVAMQCCAKIIPCTGLLRYFLTLINNWGRTEDRSLLWRMKP